MAKMPRWTWLQVFALTVLGTELVIVGMFLEWYMLIGRRL